MKKTIVLLGLLLAVSVSTLNAGNYQKSCKSSCNAAKYERYVNNYLKAAKRYEVKSEKSIKPEKKQRYLDLADICRKKAEQKKRMAEAYKTGNNELLKDAQKKYSALKENPEKIKKSLSDLSDDSSKKTYSIKLKAIERLQKQIDERQKQIEKLQNTNE